MKNKIENLLVWLLGKINKQRLEKCSISRDVNLKISKFIPDDNKWYTISFSFEYWIKSNNGEVREMQQVEIYKQGEKVSSTLEKIK